MSLRLPCRHWRLAAGSPPLPPARLVQAQKRQLSRSRDVEFKHVLRRKSVHHRHPSPPQRAPRRLLPFPTNISHIASPDYSSSIRNELNTPRRAFQLQHARADRRICTCFEGSKVSPNAFQLSVAGPPWSHTRSKTSITSRAESSTAGLFPRHRRTKDGDLLVPPPAGLQCHTPHTDGSQYRTRTMIGSASSLASRTGWGGGAAEALVRLVGKISGSGRLQPWLFAPTSHAEAEPTTDNGLGRLTHDRLHSPLSHTPHYHCTHTTCPGLAVGRGG